MTENLSYQKDIDMNMKRSTKTQPTAEDKARWKRNLQALDAEVRKEKGCKTYPLSEVRKELGL